MQKVAIVGASIAGMGVATELRECGFAGEIVLADAQSHLPYDRPPLSKGFLVDTLALPQSIMLLSEADLASKRITILNDKRAVRLDAASKQVWFDDSDHLSADIIVIATGARARSFPPSRSAGKIWSIRELDDVLSLRQEMQPGRKLAIIGGGFIGAEVASSARKLDVQVEMFEALPMPFQRIVGDQVARRLLELHEQAGVAVHCGVGVDRIDVDQGQSVLHLQDGSSHSADLVVAGLGAIPNLEWLEGAGLTLDNGIVCNNFGETSREGIFSCGDVSVWRDPETGTGHRYEHWTSAKEQARIVANAIAGTDGENWTEHVPYFWSDIHSKRFQVLGSTAPDHEVRFVFENDEKGAFVAEYWRDRRMTGVAGLAAAAKTMRYLSQLKSQLENA